MSRRKKYIAPFEVEIERLGPKGKGVGTAPDGRPVLVRGAPPGARVLVRPFSRKKGTWEARRVALIRPAAAGAIPRCARFGLCGGCVLQELDGDEQIALRAAHAIDEIAQHAALEGVTVHAPRHADASYGYRNKVELSFGTARYLSEADHAAGLPIDGRFLGFHAPGRFDRVVDAERCELLAEPGNAILATVRAHALADDAPPPSDPRTHAGFWRHLRLRSGRATGTWLVGLYTRTGSEADHACVARLAEALMSLALPDGERVVGVEHRLNDEVADVARGPLAAQWGTRQVEEHLGEHRFLLGLDSFFQVNTAGAVVLYDTIGEALQPAAGTLFDLYCGTGSIGLYLSERFEALVGIEEVEAAVADARVNAALNGVEADFTAARVEDVPERVAAARQPCGLVVDPPRAGLHPKAAKAVAAAQADVLVYVACRPASLGRDLAVLAEGGWRLTDLWTVDLFPQTGHVEAVGRFTRS